ncbi:MAG: hypothetical protein MJ090_03955 [Clostridia bacterium]|nr:hypothetical protein [Clostridia bacterium]
MSIFVDLLLLVIIILTAYISSKYGFMRTLIEVVGFILIAIIINSASMPISETIYDKFVAKSITDACNNVDFTSENSAQKVFNSMPPFLAKSSSIFGFDESNIKTKINDNISDKLEETKTKISKNVIRPILIKPLSLVVSLVMFLLLNPIVHFLAKLINGLLRGKIVGGLNAKLGFAIGIPKGIIYAVVLLLLLIFIVNIYPKGFWIFNKDVVYNSFTVKMFSNFLPDKSILLKALKV